MSVHSATEISMIHVVNEWASEDDDDSVFLVPFQSVFYLKRKTSQFHHLHTQTLFFVNRPFVRLLALCIWPNTGTQKKKEKPTEPRDVTRLKNENFRNIIFFSRCLIVFLLHTRLGHLFCFSGFFFVVYSSSLSHSTSRIHILVLELLHSDHLLLGASLLWQRISSFFLFLSFIHSLAVAAADIGVSSNAFFTFCFHVHPLAR